MRIAFNPSTVAALTSPPNNKDITFDLRGQNIFARGVKFYGTDTNTWRDIKINNVSIGSHTLDLRNGSNTTLTNTNGIVTINSTWRPVVDNLTSNSTTSSLSANQGRVLAGLINGKSDSDHNHDGRYLKLTGGTMLLGEGLKFHANNNYFGTNADARIISLLDNNGKICDGGLIIDERATLDGKEYVTELLRIRDSEFKWRGADILHSGNYSSILDSRYYTESEVNSLLSKKLDRVNLSTGGWNPRGYNLAAGYSYNGGDLSISESGSQIHVSIDGYFWQNEGRYRVLDTSDIGGIRGSISIQQYLSNTDTNWYPLIWGGSDHKNTNNSTGSLYKSHDKLSWQTSSQTLYATNIRTENIKNLSIGGGIYWNPHVESATDGSDAASITLVKSGVAGGTTLVLSQQNDASDTIQFKTNTTARLYHNSNQILTSGDTKVSSGKGYINNTEITQVNNSDTLDGWHKDNIQGTGYITSSNSLTSYWFKMYDITVTGYQYNDITITFLVSEGYTAHFSIFYLKIRQNGTNNSGNYNLVVTLRELVGNLRDKVVAYYNNSTGNVQLWGNTDGQWGTMNYTIIKKTTRTATDSSSLGTLTAQSFSSVQTPPSTGYTKLTMSRVGSVSYSDSTGSVHWNNVTNKPSTFNPAAHTHSWASITDKIVAGNEFNIVNAGFKEGMWFNYLPINDRSKTATISSYHFGNGAKGYASIVASGFIKSGGNASQLLRADGGVATFNWSGQSGQPTWLWGGNSQHSYYVYNPSNFKVASATKLQTARKIWGQSFDGTTDIDNTLRIRKTTGNYCEGIRIQTGDGNWATIILGATADSGTNTNAWSIHRKSDNNFAISRNSSDGANGLVMTPTGMGLGTTAPTQRLEVAGNIRATGQLYLPTNGNYNAILMGDDCWMGDCNIGNVIGLSGRGDANAGGIKFGKGGMHIGYNGSNHYSSGTSLWSNFNADLLDGVHVNQLCRVYTFNVHNEIIKVGTLTSGQYGHVCKLRFNSGIGCNALNQDKAMTVVIRASNGFANSYGFYFEAHSESYRAGAFTTFYLHQTSKTQCELYMAAFNYSGQSTYEVSFSAGDLWVNEISHQNALPTSSIFTLPNYQIAYSDYNIASATKLATARSIWGQSFDGTRDVNGTIYINNSDSENGAIILNNNVNTHARISAIGDQVVFNTGSALRFGGTEWEYSDWAGLKYDTVANTIYLGIADGTVFNYYSSKRSNGTLKLPGISSIDLNSGTSIIAHATNGSPYNSRVTLYDTSISLLAYGDISMSTGPGAIELTAGQGAKANIGSDFKIEASRGVYLNQGNSGNVWLCQGGGNVSIGYSTPSYKLDVNGQIRASGFHHSSVNSDNYMLLAGGGYKSFGGDNSNPIFLGYLNLYHGNDGTISSSFLCLGYSVPFTYTRGGNYCRIYIPDTTHQVFYIGAATASVHYSGGGMDTWTGVHRGSGAWWLHCYAESTNEVRVKGFCQNNSNNDSWWGGNPLWSGNNGVNRITVCIFGYVKFR